MPDDGSSKKNESERVGSLVERAMRGVRGARRSPATDVRAEDPEAKQHGHDVDGGANSAIVRMVATSQSTKRSTMPRVGPAENSSSVASRVTPGGGAPAGDETEDPVTHSTQRVQSRFVELDFASLQAMGFITPNQARTRTTEEFRLIKRSILQGISAARSEGRRNPNLVMVTSAGPAEGKTFSAINLAISIASEPDLNTLLIDADLVKPSVFETLEVDAGRGLVDVIESGDFNLADVLVRTNVEGMTLLGAGTPNPMATELIASERMRQFVDDVAQRYQDRVVIFDAPPLLATSEAAVLTEHMAQIVFVVEADRTSRNQAKEALDMIGAGPRVGLVLNKASARFGARQFGAYYKSYSKD